MRGSRASGPGGTTYPDLPKRQDHERGELTFRFDEPLRLGVGAVLQARF